MAKKSAEEKSGTFDVEYIVDGVGFCCGEPAASLEEAKAQVRDRLEEYVKNGSTVEVK